MKLYRGQRRSDGPVVWVDEYRHADTGAPPQVVCSSRDLPMGNHACGQFEWGYVGSGPAQLALAVLLDLTGSPALAEEWGHELMRTVICNLGPRWTMAEDTLKSWLSGRVSQALVDATAARLLGITREEMTHERASEYPGAAGDPERD